MQCKPIVVGPVDSSFCQRALEASLWESGRAQVKAKARREHEKKFGKD